ncbi:MAG TPA: NADP-dependent oxidoreductase [Polyangia bacterium]|jgi:NADPH:quinone reductase-like Zn-dependent oxidoreductase|nr:NADP-dependent oxidoreductase [Polyangia bacterium]
MRAIVLPEYGPPSALKLQTLPDPKPGPNEILVRMAGASLNPVDLKQRSGDIRQRMPLTFPAVLGKDASGTIAAMGPGVTGFAVGDRVLGRVPGGAYAELVLGPLDAWARVPAKLDLADAGALPLVVLTGAQLAEQATDARAGETILVTGALGGVGRAAVFAAKGRGAKVYAGVRARQKTEAAKLGADAVVALDDDGEIAKLPTLDGIADTVSGETIQKLLAKLKPGGKIGSVLGEPPGAKEKGFVVRAFMTRSDPKRLGELAQAVADGRLVIPIAKRFPLAEAAAAHELAETHVGGKLLLLG